MKYSGIFVKFIETLQILVKVFHLLLRFMFIANVYSFFHIIWEAECKVFPNFQIVLQIFVNLFIFLKYMYSLFHVIGKMTA